MAANAGANNPHLVGRGEATVETEDDRFAANRDTHTGARLCEPQHAPIFETFPANPNAFQAAKPLRVTDPRSDYRALALGGCIQMRPSLWSLASGVRFRKTCRMIASQK